MVKLETTVIECNTHDHTTRVCGKNGTSIPYMGNCPVCGSSNVYVKSEVIDTSDPDVDYYAENTNVRTSEP